MPDRLEVELSEFPRLPPEDLWRLFRLPFSFG
jgi:hypothetical protein